MLYQFIQSLFEQTFFPANYEGVFFIYFHRNFLAWSCMTLKYLASVAEKRACIQEETFQVSYMNLWGTMNGWCHTCCKQWGCVWLRWGCSGHHTWESSEPQKRWEDGITREADEGRGWRQSLMEEMNKIMAILESLQLKWQMGKAIIMFELVDPSAACLNRIILPSPAKPQEWLSLVL